MARVSGRRLVELHPRWFAQAERSGQGLIFDCPCARCAAAPEGPIRLAAAFGSPLDGGAPIALGKIEALWNAIKASDDGNSHFAPPGVAWQNTGTSFDTLTLRPSLDYSKAGHWHGHIIDGAVR